MRDDPLRVLLATEYALDIVDSDHGHVQLPPAGKISAMSG